MIIYKATNIINNKPYVGQTIKTLGERINIHLHSSHCSAFHSALIKYGLDIFEWKIIDTAKDIDELNKLEVRYIKKYNCIAPNGYNLTAGGLNYKKSEEHKRKISEAQKGEKAYWFGKHPSEETKRKVRIANIGRHHTEESKRKMSKAQKGHTVTEETRKKISKMSKGHKLSEESKRKLSEARKGEKNHNYGKHLSEETRRKLSEINTGKNHPMFGKYHSEETRRKMSEAAKRRWEKEREGKDN